jgi:hypothetical protein
VRSISISRPTPAFVLAFIALLCALAGTGYAAATISGKSIKKRSVPANRVVPNALGGKQVNESRLGEVPAAVQAQSALTAETANSAAKAETADSATTAQTAAKADLATDSEQLGGRAPSAYLRSKPVARIALSINIAAGNGVEDTASCLSGEVAVGGGGAFYIAGTDTTVGSATLSTSAPLLDAEGTPVAWRAEGKNTSPVPRDFRAWVVCAPTG